MEHTTVITRGGSQETKGVTVIIPACDKPADPALPSDQI